MRKLSKVLFLLIIGFLFFDNISAANKMKCSYSGIINKITLSTSESYIENDNVIPKNAFANGFDLWSDGPGSSPNPDYEINGTYKDFYEVTLTVSGDEVVIQKIQHSMAYNLSQTISNDDGSFTTKSHILTETELEDWTQHFSTFDIEVNEGEGCPEYLTILPPIISMKKVYGESTTSHQIKKDEKGNVVGKEVLETYNSLCNNYKKEETCRGSKDSGGEISCVWVDKDKYDFLEKGYCNVDNLLYVGCGGASDIPMQIPRLISLAVNLLKIATPIILIFISIITLIKAMSGQKEDEIKKATSALVKKIIAAALVFFIVSIVQFIVSVVAKDEGDYNDFENCLDCFLNNSCMENTYYKTVVAGEDLCTQISTGKTDSCEK